MSQSVIPEDIAAFIAERIDSVAQMEALLFLRKNAGEAWPAAAVAKVLYIEEHQAANLLSGLAGAGFVVREGDASPRFRHGTPPGDAGRLLEVALDLYSRHLVPMTNLIHAKPRSRVQKFADAFRLRKEG